MAARRSALAAAALAAVVLTSAALVWHTFRPLRRRPREPALVDVTAALGIDFVHRHGGTGERLLPETMGSGACWLDHDGDGDMDLYVVQAAGPNVLFENLRGRFRRVEGAAGAADAGYGMGAVAADYDNDGDPDLLVTNFGPDALYRNDGGRFTDVTRQAGLGDPGWGTAAAFGDFDGDGLLDLYVARYLDYDLATAPPCYQGKLRAYCSPDDFQGVPDLLYRNLGDGRFQEVSAERGVAAVRGKGLGVLTLDADADGDLDVYVANDAVENTLWWNDGTGHFQDGALLAGLAYGEDGRPQAGMGVDAGDVDGDGLEDIVVTNFQKEPNDLYRALGGGLYAEESAVRGVAESSYHALGFGVAYLDLERDGDLDFYVANGHVYDNVEAFEARATYAQRDLLYINDGRGLFQEVGARAGPGGREPFPAAVGRGLALADYDEDGDLDLYVAHCNGPGVLLRNDHGDGRHWLGVRLVGTTSGGDAAGALVRVIAPGHTTQGQVHALGGQHASAHEAALRFGLGDAGGPATVELRWPSGIRQTVAAGAVDRYLGIAEPPCIQVRPRVLPADGRSAAEVTVWARAADGSLLPGATAADLGLANEAGGVGALAPLAPGPE
ncbi:MAG: CRTAC1 family protein, partial [Planctomycetes bacterium]|nr:CRTAC1 family protein [Planctomycetota bacterium]